MYSDEMKLRILCKNINADFLQNARAGINIELSKIPMTMTYAHALVTFRNEVNRKFPPDMTNNNNRSRRIDKIGSYQKNSFQCRGRGRGRGRGSEHRNGKRKSAVGAQIIKGFDGNYIEVHPSYNFPPNIWHNISDNDKHQLREERYSYKRFRQASSVTHSDRSTVGGYWSYVPIPPPPSPGQPVASPSQIAVVNTNPTKNDNQTTVSSIAFQRESTMFEDGNE